MGTIVRDRTGTVISASPNTGVKAGEKLSDSDAKKLSITPVGKRKTTYTTSKGGSFTSKEQALAFESGKTFEQDGVIYKTNSTGGFERIGFTAEEQKRRDARISGNAKASDVIKSGDNILNPETQYRVFNAYNNQVRRENAESTKKAYAQANYQDTKRNLFSVSYSTPSQSPITQRAPSPPPLKPNFWQTTANRINRREQAISEEYQNRLDSTRLSFLQRKEGEGLFKGTAKILGSSAFVVGSDLFKSAKYGLFDKKENIPRLIIPSALLNTGEKASMLTLATLSPNDEVRNNALKEGRRAGKETLFTQLNPTKPEGLSNIVFAGVGAGVSTALTLNTNAPASTFKPTTTKINGVKVKPVNGIKTVTSKQVASAEARASTLKSVGEFMTFKGNKRGAVFKGGNRVSPKSKTQLSKETRNQYYNPKLIVTPQEIGMKFGKGNINAIKRQVSTSPSGTKETINTVLTIKDRTGLRTTQTTTRTVKMNQGRVTDININKQLTIGKGLPQTTGGKGYAKFTPQRPLTEGIPSNELILFSKLNQKMKAFDYPSLKRTPNPQQAPVFKNTPSNTVLQQKAVSQQKGTPNLYARKPTVNVNPRQKLVDAIKTRLKARAEASQKQKIIIKPQPSQERFYSNPQQTQIISTPSYQKPSAPLQTAQRIINLNPQEVLSKRVNPTIFTTLNQKSKLATAQAQKSATASLTGQKLTLIQKPELKLFASPTLQIGKLAQRQQTEQDTKSDTKTVSIAKYQQIADNQVKLITLPRIAIKSKVQEDIALILPQKRISTQKITTTQQEPIVRKKEPIEEIKEPRQQIRTLPTLKIRRPPEKTERQIVPPLFKSSPRNQPQEAGRGFIAITRRGGIWERIGKGVYSQRDALAFASSRVRKTARASFRIIPTREAPTTSFKGAFNLAGFYKKGDTYIQERNQRIKTSGEKKEITFKGISTKRKRRTARGIIL